MKLISERALKLNQLHLVLKDEDGEIIGNFYPHISKKEKLETIMRGRRLGKIDIKGTITSKNISNIASWFIYLNTFCKSRYNEID